MKFVNRAKPSSDMENLQQHGKHWPQYLAVITATIAAFACGTHFAWTSPSIPILISDNFHINITKEEASYIPVIGPVGNVIGAPLTAIFAGTIGRKPTILLIAVPHIISWLIIAFANSTWLFYLARFIAGLSEGAVFIVIPMYIGEVSQPAIRGKLGSIVSVSFITGILFINCIGPYFSIQFSAFLCIIFPVMLLSIFCWMPETPYYYIMKGRKEDAKKSLQFLRKMDNVDAELTKLSNDVERQLSEPGTFKDLFTIKSNLKAFLIIIGLRTTQQFSGVSAFGLNTHTIFRQASDNISANMSVIIYTVVQILMTWIGSFFIDKFGRKPVLLLSCLGSTFVLAVTSIYFYLKEKTDYDISSIYWLPLAGMLTYVCLFSVGLGTVPNLMLGELFSASVKGKSLFILNIYYAILISTIAKFYQAMADNFGMYVPFAIFAACCLLGSLFSHFCVPETKGKSLEEIQQHLKGHTENKTENRC